MKKKVMLITSSGQIGGVEKITHTIWKELKKNNIEIKVVKVFKNKKEENYLYNEDEMSIPYNKVFIEKNIFKKIYRLLKDIIVISYFKKINNIDVSIGMGEMCSILNGLTLTKDLKLGSIHGKKTEFKGINKIISKLAFSNLKKIICISRGVKNEIEKKCSEINKDKLKIIYNPHDIENIIKRSKEKLTKEEKIIFSKKTFLFVGRIDENKGVKHLIKIFKQKKKELQDYNLVIIGEGIVFDEINDIKNIYHLGYKENPYKYIGRAYAIVLSSYSEGLPNVLIESLILEKPIISTNSSEGIWEIMKKDKIITQYKENLNQKIIADVGIITPKFTLENLNKKELSFQEIEFFESLKLLDELYLNFIQNIEKVLKKFNTKEIIEEYKKILNGED